MSTGIARHDPPGPAARDGAPAGRGRDPRRRRAILHAADRVIRRDGPDAPMSAIAAAAGISKPILYRHFGDKSGLYRALAERHADAVVARVRAEFRGPADLHGRARATVGAYLGMIHRDLNLYRFLVHRATAEDPRTRGDIGLTVRRLGEELAGLLVAEGHVADPVSARITAHAVIGMVQAAGEWWLDHPEVDRATVVERLTSAVVGAITGSPARA
ncbi:TetR family transcriptional regulator [Marinactinospora rubrisoli]|uniref:TetR family transcriptional regulator n=1 Tax=Marinactinospora rubrisoli TaxID=2715399 RepID=A0ABW2KEU5_9ACTN